MNCPICGMNERVNRISWSCMKRAINVKLWPLERCKWMLPKIAGERESKNLRTKQVFVHSIANWTISCYEVCKFKDKKKLKHARKVLLEIRTNLPHFSIIFMMKNNTLEIYLFDVSISCCFVFQFEWPDVMEFVGCQASTGFQNGVNIIFLLVWNKKALTSQ